MPKGRAHGWGIAGQKLSEEISKLPPIVGVTFHGIRGVDLLPMHAADWDLRNIGYTFFENDIEVLEHTRRAAREWDYIVAGSTWCEHHLRIGGVKNTCTILQGIDPGCFAPRPPLSDDESFIVFSGGKFEFRKGQDLVIAAMKIMMERHRDVRLSCSWYNQWAFSMATMSASPHISFRLYEEDCLVTLRRTLAGNGIPLDRVDLHPLCDNARMAELYAASHVGLFPNRCEGGNNMVMCEYMACGRPVIASDTTGHADVISDLNSFPLTSYRPFVMEMKGRRVGVWFEPSLEEIVASLEQAYLDRQPLKQKGSSAANDMRRLNWQEAARQFHSIGMNLRGEKRTEPEEQPKLAQSVIRQLFSEVLENTNETDVSAIDRLLDAVRLDERNGDLHFALAQAYAAQGDTEKAVDWLRRGVSLHPEKGEHHFRLGNLLAEREEYEEAANCYRRAVALDNRQLAGWEKLGTTCLKLKRFDEAVDSFRRMTDIAPENAAAHNNLAVALQSHGDLQGAIFSFQRALALMPEYAQAWHNLGFALETAGRYREAIDATRHAIALNPSSAETHYNLATLLLLTGEFEEGWREHEWRWDALNFSTKRREFPLPKWDGSPLGGKTILLDFEQGAGDMIQFVRYAQLVAERGGKVMLMSPPRLRRLLATVPWVDTVKMDGEKWGEFHCYVPLMELPRIFGTTLDSIPAPIPYISALPELSAAWQERVCRYPGRKIGIVWAGNPLHRNDANRSCTLADLAPLRDIEEVTFFSLQVGKPAADAESLSAGPPMLDLTEAIDDYADTAAFIDNLDLVISVDTSVAHVAGALGKPVWMLLPWRPDWRWLLERDDSPWYPTMRLFRQERPGDWRGVLQRVVAALRESPSE